VVDWRQPEGADRFWVWDGMHCPKPLTPLSQDFAAAVVAANDRLRGAGPDDRWRTQFIHGYWYSVFDPPDPQAEPDPVQKEREERTREEARRLSSLWHRRWRPRIRRICRSLAEANYAAITLDDLSARLPDLIERGGLAFGITLYAANPMFEAVSKLYEFCEQELGADGLALAGAAIQGYRNESSASDTALWEVARAARRSGVDAAVRETPAEALPELLRQSTGGRAFLSALDDYLDRYGWRAPTWWELSQPAWREDALPLLRNIKQMLSGGIEEAESGLRRAARGRRSALRRARTAFGDPGKRARFEGLWRTARQFVPVSEGRALWQLSLGGYLRVPALALGEKLRRAGYLYSAEDVFYLYASEIAGGDRASWHDLTHARRAQRQHWLEVVPPSTLGRRPQAQPGAEPASLPFGARMVSGFGTVPSADASLLQGNAASPGVVRARARLVETLDQAESVEPGEVLVCRFTTPSWTPLFSRVSAIVADSGGVLSHCAILAREYGIPCVAGVRVGTRRIRDGMMLTVDGNQGIVRLEN